MRCECVNKSISKLIWVLSSSGGSYPSVWDFLKGDKFSLAKMQFGMYIALSHLAAIATVAWAFSERTQFYPSIVLMVNNKAAFMVTPPRHVAQPHPDI